MTLISRTWLDGSIPVATPVVEGRVIRTEIWRDNSSMAIWNVHNFDLGEQQMKEIEGMAQCDVAEADTDPTRRSVVLAGDWNFCPTDEPGFDLKNAVGSFAVNSENNFQNAPAWKKILLPFTDIHAGYVTHWSEQRQSASRLDRVYAATPD